MLKSSGKSADQQSPAVVGRWSGFVLFCFLLRCQEKMFSRKFTRGFGDAHTRTHTMCFHICYTSKRTWTVKRLLVPPVRPQARQIAPEFTILAVAFCFCAFAGVKVFGNKRVSKPCKMFEKLLPFMFKRCSAPSEPALHWLCPCALHPIMSVCCWLTPAWIQS